MMDRLDDGAVAMAAETQGFETSGSSFAACAPEIATLESGFGAAALSAEDCPVRDVLDRLGDAWSFLVVWRLAGGLPALPARKARAGGVARRVCTLPPSHP